MNVLRLVVDLIWIVGAFIVLIALLMEQGPSDFDNLWKMLVLVGVGVIMMRQDAR